MFPPPIPDWLRDKLTRCRRHGRCGQIEQYPDNVPKPVPDAWPPYPGSPAFLDYSFDDPAQWDVSPTVPGALQVTGGQVVAANAYGNVVPHTLLFNPWAGGEVVDWHLEVDSVTGGQVFCGFGGGDFLWTEADGAGVFEGEKIMPAGTQGALLLFLGADAIINEFRVSRRL